MCLLTSNRNPALPVISQHSNGSVLAKGLILLVAVPAVAIGVYWYLTFPNVAGLAKINPRSTAFIETRSREGALLLERGVYDPLQLKAPGTPIAPRRMVPGSDGWNGEPGAKSRRVRQFWIWVPLSRISRDLQRAVIVAEDATFYHHHGFDWEGIRGAATRNWDRGELRRGGSTITQQLAKNLYLSPEKNLLRKIHEAAITRALEERLTKKRILELYLNVVEWGKGVYGAEAAAQHHFGKSAQDLGPEEAALLAAILPSPRRYDPLRVTPYLVRRQQQILSRMH
jgi:monofunctional biosynthetic peptidoglycan transglycosylase